MSQNMFRRAQEKHDPEYGKELVLHYLPPPPDSVALFSFQTSAGKGQ